MHDLKKQLESKINDIDKMLSELDFSETNQDDVQHVQPIDPKIDINTLDVVDVLHGILN